MSPLPGSPPEAVSAPKAAKLRAGDNLGGDSSPFAAMNPFLDHWLEAVASDRSLPAEACGVAGIMARSVGIGRVAFTDWQRINTALGRNRRDLSVFEVMSELALEGYIDRNIDERFGPNYGWSLLIPEGEL